MSDDTKVKVVGLTKKFGDLLVLNDISFNVKKGDFVCIVGPTGCGKTTFLNLLVKLIKPTSGQILIDGEPADPKKHNIAFVFQEPSAYPWLTVEENLQYGLKIKKVDQKTIEERTKEITCVAVLSDHELGKKGPIVSNGFYPSIAMIDPELTYTLPPRITASTGIDVLCHALEGFWSKGHQPVCDALALHACEIVFKYLRRAYKDPQDKEARAKMAEASVIAGLAFTLPKTTSSHACSFPLTNLYHIPHGEACGLTLDCFARINAEVENGRVHEFARKLGFADTYALADAIHELKVDLGLRLDLKDFNLTDEQVAELVKTSHHPNMLNNPVEITDEILNEMYQSMR